MSRISILSSQHLPDDVRVTHRIGKRLREEGHEVTWVGPRRNRTGDDYGIRFVYYPLGAGKLGRLTHAARLLRAARALGPQDVYFAVEPDSAAVALKLARENRGRAVFDIHEIYHEEMLMRWVPRPFLRILGWWVRQRISNICRQCDLVVGVGQTRLDPYTARDRPRLLVRHCVPTGFAPGPVPGPFSQAGRPLTILHGKATMNHGTREMLQAVALLKHEHAVPCKVILFALRPDAASFQATDVGRLARELDIEDTIDLRAMIPYKAMFPLMQTCDVGVIAYGQAFGRKCMPNRIFEYMASGIPVVAPAYALELEGLIRQHQCGVLCNTEDSQDLAATLLRLWNEKGLAQRMGANGRAAFEDKLNWECESQPLMDWFRSPASVCPETAEAMTP